MGILYGECIQAGWPEPTPDVLLNFMWNSNNDFGTDFSSFANPEFDGILAQLSTAACTVEARQPLYYRLQEIIHDDAISDFISTTVDYAVTSARIGNYEITAWGQTPVWEWTISN